MSGLKMYVQNPEDWKQLPDKNSTPRPYYLIQKGKGSSLQTIGPMQGQILNAKIKLRKQIKRSTNKKTTQSKVTKTRRRVGQRAPVKKKKPSSNSKKQKNKKPTKGRKRKTKAKK